MEIYDWLMSIRVKMDPIRVMLLKVFISNLSMLIDKHSFSDDITI